MPAIKDLQQTVEYTTDDPYTNNSPTWVEIPAVRLDGDSERPSEEVPEAGLMDGRSTSGGYRLTGQYAVRKDASQPDAVIGGLEDADADHTPVWFRETDLQSGTTAQVLGGRKGCIVRVGESGQGFEGHRIRGVQYVATEAEAGFLIQDDPNATGSS